MVAILQQLTRTFASSYGGLAGVLPDGDAVRSAGPLNPNPFGQVLATSAVLAFYLACIETRALGGDCSPAASRWPAWSGVVYSQSRAALIALRSGLSRSARSAACACACSPSAATAAVALGLLVAAAEPGSSGSARFATCATTNPVALQDTSLRGRAARTSPPSGCGRTTRSSASDRTTSRSTTWATPRRSGSTARPEERGAHNLYLESLAETGVLGALAFLGVAWLALAGAWRARTPLRGPRRPAGRGPVRRAGRLPHLRADPAQRLRALPVDLPRAWPRRRPPGPEAGAMTAGLHARSIALVVWVYAGYPLALALLGRLRPRPRRRAPSSCRCRSSSPPTTRSPSSRTRSPTSGRPTTEPTLVELIVASDGSEDGTVEAARRAGATQVLDLPRMGKLAALNRAAEASSGEILVFTDADSLLEPGTLRELTSNFADETVGGVAANVVRCVAEDGRPVARGEGALLALRTSAQAARGPGRERRLGQRPPVRGAPQPLHARRRRPPAPTTS